MGKDGEWFELQGKIIETVVFKIALIQHLVQPTKSQTLAHVRQLIGKASASGAHVVSLSVVLFKTFIDNQECFNTPYSNAHFKENAEASDGVTVNMLQQAAKESKIVLIGGSIPELHQGRLFNTCFVFGPDGTLLGKHRKLHLFDICIPGKIEFRESDTFTAGNEVTVVETPFGKIGVGICYDLRLTGVEVFSAAFTINFPF